jgi:hypothetical protein
VGDGTTHHNNRAHAPCKLWVKAEGEPEVGEWANGEQINLAGHLAREAQDLRDRILSDWSALWCGLVRIAETIFAMHPLGGGERLRHRSACTNGDWHVVETAELKEATGVGGGKVRGDVAVHTADSEKFNVAAPSEVEHGDCIIDPHVGVEQDFSAFHEGECTGSLPLLRA